MRKISLVLLVFFYIFLPASAQVCNKELKNTSDSVYLMSYFKANEQHLFYAYSEDGLNWTDINNSKPIFYAYDKSIWLRDPFVKRVTQNGVTKFHLIHTWGWDNPAIFHWESNDLITWKATNGGTSTNDGRIFVMDGKNGNMTAKNAWAPEFSYDKKSDTFYIYWASDNGTGYLQHCYCTTKDWKTFTPSSIYFDPGFTTIDMTILEHENMYYAYYKDERNGQKRIRVATSKSLDPHIDKFEGTTDMFPLYEMEVEGPETFKAIGQNKWFMYWDKFINDQGVSYAVSFDPASRTWAQIPDKMTKDPSDVKHGSVEIISKSELQKILNHFNK